MLHIENVRQSFRSGFWLKPTEILKGISFVVPRKSVFGFLGPNGAGKTTLIHLITGIKQPISGSIQIDGLPTTNRETKKKIGYLPERPYFYDHLTGEQLLRYFGRLTGMAESEITIRIPLVLESVGMSHARKVELRKYSKGMLQRIGIAQALIHNPELLVLDEPMSGLDPVGRKEIRELILQLARDGRTIFFSSHVIPDVEMICDSVAMIRKGELVGCGLISQYLSRNTNPVEIAFSGVPIDQVGTIAKFTLVRETSEGIRATLDSDRDVDGALRNLLDVKAKIHWVNPIRPSLEDSFL